MAKTEVEFLVIFNEMYVDFIKLNVNIIAVEVYSSTSSSKPNIKGFTNNAKYDVYRVWMRGEGGEGGGAWCSLIFRSSFEHFDS